MPAEPVITAPIEGSEVPSGALRIEWSAIPGLQKLVLETPGGPAMSHLRALAFVILVCIGTASGDELTGLWTAKGRFGPDTRGPLIILKYEAAYSADMLGRRAPVHLAAGELGFELPDRLGRFRGKVEGKRILGHWFRFFSSRMGLIAGAATLIHSRTNSLSFFSWGTSGQMDR